jgi:hypothetical protein
MTLDASRGNRVVEISPELAEHLHGHLRTWKPNPLNLIFATSEGTPWDIDTVRKRKLHPLRRKLGIGRAGFHAFRDGNATIMHQGIGRGIESSTAGCKLLSHSLFKSHLQNHSAACTNFLLNQVGGWTETTLHSFSGRNDGSLPSEARFANRSAAFESTPEVTCQQPAVRSASRFLPASFGSPASSGDTPAHGHPVNALDARHDPLNSRSPLQLRHRTWEPIRL